MLIYDFYEIKKTILKYQNELWLVLKSDAYSFGMETVLNIGLSCEIFEIKHSKEVHPEQYRHLIDEQKLKETEFRYGDITRRCVIYNGESHIENDVEYLNVEEY